MAKTKTTEATQADVRKPNNPNVNQVEVTTTNNTVTLDPTMPANHTSVVNVKVNARGKQEETTVTFQARAKKKDLVPETTPALVDGMITGYANEPIEVYIDTTKYEADSKPFTLTVETSVTNDGGPTPFSGLNIIEVTPVKVDDPNNSGQQKDSDSAWIVTSKTNEPIAGSLKLSHEDYEDFTLGVKFLDPKKKPTIKYMVSGDDDAVSVGVPFALQAWCDTQPVSIAKINSHSLIQVIGANTAEALDGLGEAIPVVTSTFEITLLSEGKHELELRSFDGQARLLTFHAYDLNVGEYMKLNDTTLVLRKNEEKYVLGEVAPEDNDMTVESDAIDSGNIQKTKVNGNRIYIKGINPGTYTVKVKSKRYKNSEFKVIVKDEDMPTAPQVEEKEYYDLGKAPTGITLADVNEDNFMTKVVELSDKTSKEKLCYVVSQEDYSNYKIMADMICQANQDIKTSDVLTATKGVEKILKAIKLVIEQEDYIIFKQLYLAVKLGFDHYSKEGVLKEDNILYFAARTNELELISQMVKYILDDVNGKLKDFNVANMTDKINFRSKDRLVRYIRELPATPTSPTPPTGGTGSNPGTGSTPDAGQQPSQPEQGDSSQTPPAGDGQDQSQKPGGDQTQNGGQAGNTGSQAPSTGDQTQTGGSSTTSPTPDAGATTPDQSQQGGASTTPGNTQQNGQQNSQPTSRKGNRH